MGFPRVFLLKRRRTFPPKICVEGLAAPRAAPSHPLSRAWQWRFAHLISAPNAGRGARSQCTGAGRGRARLPGIRRGGRAPRPWPHEGSASPRARRRTVSLIGTRSHLPKVTANLGGDGDREAEGRRAFFSPSPFGARAPGAPRRRFREPTAPTSGRSARSAATAEPSGGRYSARASRRAEGPRARSAEWGTAAGTRRCARLQRFGLKNLCCIPTYSML